MFTVPQTDINAQSAGGSTGVGYSAHVARFNEVTAVFGVGVTAGKFLVQRAPTLAGPWETFDDIPYPGGGAAPAGGVSVAKQYDKPLNAIRTQIDPLTPMVGGTASSLIMQWN